MANYVAVCRSNYFRVKDVAAFRAWAEGLAAANRENTMGDPLRFIEVKAELRDATADARALLARLQGEGKP